MNALTVQENKALQSMPIKLKPFVQARFSKAIKDYNGMELENAILDMVQVLLIEAGGKTESDEKVIRHLKDTLYRDLRTPKYNHLPLAEIKLALELGVRLEYGDYFGINITTIYSWIRAFQEDANRKNALQEFGRIAAAAEQTSEVPLRVKIQRSLQSIVNAFDYYRQEGKISFCGFAYYDILNEILGVEYKGIKTLVDDPATRKVIFEKSEGEYLKELRIKKAKAEGAGDNDTAQKIGDMMVNVREQFTLVNKQKELLLAAYFDKLIRENIDLRELLKDKL